MVKKNSPKAKKSPKTVSKGKTSDSEIESLKREIALLKNIKQKPTLIKMEEASFSSVARGIFYENISTLLYNIFILFIVIIIIFVMAILGYVFT